VTLFRVRVLDTPVSPFDGGTLRSDEDAGILVEHGLITVRGPFAEVRSQHPDAEVLDLRDGVLLPGLVDTHVHFPQVRVIGGLGMPLLDWLDQYALPEELRLADVCGSRPAWSCRTGCCPTAC
jgi:guanine deaminase